MRHDPASAAVVVMLRGLKMYGMAQAVSDLIEQGAPAFDAAVPILSQLLKAEMAEREVRSITYQTKAARFPAYKDLTGFDFASSEVNEAMVRQLHRGDFIDGANNVVLIGGPGTGKTHIATALGIQAVEHHRKKVRFFGKRCSQATAVHGMSSPTLFAGWPLASFSSVCASQVCGLMPLSLQFSISVAITAQLSPPSSDPANKAFLRFRASGLMLRSTALLSRSRRPSSRNRERPAQRVSA